MGIDPLPGVAWLTLWTVLGAVIGPSRGLPRWMGGLIGLFFSIFGIGYLLLRARVTAEVTQTPAGDPIVVRTYEGADVQAISEAFVTDSRVAYENGYAVLSQQWGPSSLTVTYERARVAAAEVAPAPPYGARLILGGAVIAVLGVALPWVSAGIFTRSGTDTVSGWGIAIGAVLAAIFALVIRRNGSALLRLLVIIGGGLMLFEALSVMWEILSLATSPYASVGVGLVLCALGSVLIVVGALVARRP